MKWIGQHIWDFVSRFRNDVYFEGLAETAETRGLVVDANGKVSINPLSGDEHATHIYENVRNDEGATIPVGTPVYSKGEIGGSERILVGIADASDPDKMPAIGITNTELTTTGSTQDGLITLVGVYNTNLSGFSGVSENDIVYVAIGGGLTITKPTGANLIQNVGIVLKTNGPGTIIQGLQVTCIGRTNDVPTPLYIDHANQRLGIGTTAPDHKFHVEFTNGDTSFSGGSLGNWGSDGIRIENTSGTADTMAMLQFRNADADIHIAGIRQGTNDSDLGFFFEGSEKVRITSAGNVGIGTSSPGQKLTVDEGYINVTGAGTSHGYMLSRDGLDTYRIRHLDGGLTIQNSTDARKEMTFDGSGNVGIGTASPAQAFDVVGNIAVSGSVQRQISTTHHTFTFGAAGSASQDYWVPFIGSSEQAAPNVTHRTVAPYTGVLKKAIVHSTVAYGTSAQVRFHRINNGTSSVFVNDNSTDDVTTNVTADMSTAYSSVAFDFTTGNTFSAGDQIGVSFVRDNTGLGDVAITLVWEYELF